MKCKSKYSLLPTDKKDNLKGQSKHHPITEGEVESEPNVWRGELALFMSDRQVSATGTNLNVRRLQGA